MDVNGIVAQATRQARRRNQTPSTAHLLLVMLQRGCPAGALLQQHGVLEAELLRALQEVDPETESTLTRVIERTRKIASRHGDSPRTLHLLLAITKDVRTAGHRSLDRVGATPGDVADDLQQRLQVPDRQMPPSFPDRDLGTRAVRRQPTPPRRGKKRPKKNARIRELQEEAKREAEAKAEAAKQATQQPADLDPIDGLEIPPPRRPRSGRPRARRDPDKATPLPDELPSLSLPLGPFDLDPKHFPVLCDLGRNLTALAADGRFDPVIGRDDTIELLLDVLARRRSNNPVIVGPPGVGKTAVVEGLAQRLADGGEGVRGLEGKIVIEMSAGSLVSGTGVRGALAEKMRVLRDEVQRAAGRVILFIDEIHAIVGGDGPDGLASELKASLARGELPCIGATTDAEYRQHFEKDAALARRFSAIRIDEPNREATQQILAGVAPRYGAHHHVSFDEDALDAAIDLSVRFLPDRRLPDKAIGVLDFAAARTRRRGGEVVDRAAVAGVIAEQARVPVERLLMRDGERLEQLETLLAQRVVGHTDAMRRIADSLRRGAAGFRGKRPLGTFLFLGPTGVGKTETAKAISDVFFGCPMTRLDMSELGESHATARMLGAPPGYVGHDDGGQLTEAVRKRPYQLVLLDEIEKAHPEVLLSLLPLLDEGRLTDGKGRTSDFTNTIIVMTSNLGVQSAAKRSIGFAGEGAEQQDRVALAARKALPPELWNRIDEPIVFAPLDREEVAIIGERMCEQVAADLHARARIDLRFDGSAIDALLDLGGFDPAFGARPMRRTVARLVESPLASLILAGTIARGAKVRVFRDGDKLRFRPV